MQNHLKPSAPAEPCTMLILPTVHNDRAQEIDRVATDSGVKRVIRYKWTVDEPEAA